MPPTLNSKPIKRYCIPVQKNLEKCLNKQDFPEKCDYLRKILKMCMKRDKNIFRRGP